MIGRILNFFDCRLPGSMASGYAKDALFWFGSLGVCLNHITAYYQAFKSAVLHLCAIFHFAVALKRQNSVSIARAQCRDDRSTHHNQGGHGTFP
mmetsp:Transcript_37879/g.60837  ORF Transcript_37879/g.60837 Transcript_37879/m.60837 type:complete len:94 (+) Transcript_37879:646-927(+)